MTAGLLLSFIALVPVALAAVDVETTALAAEGSNPQIALTLVVVNKKADLVSKTMESLGQSDIMDHNPTLFIWMADQISAAGLAVKDWAARNPNIHVQWRFPTDKNQYGVVRPHIELMNELQRAYWNFDYVVEITDKMLFPRKWFDQLWRTDVQLINANDNTACGILMPMVHNTYNPLKMTVPQLEKEVQQWSSKKQVEINPLWVQPWVLKKSLLEKVGYYNSSYSPAEGQQEDLYMRALEQGFKGCAIPSSWVGNAGRTVMKFPGNVSSDDLIKEHEELFKQKWGMSYRQFHATKLNSFEPTSKFLQLRQNWEDAQKNKANKPVARNSSNYTDAAIFPGSISIPTVRDLGPTTSTTTTSTTTTVKSTTAASDEDIVPIMSKKSNQQARY